MHYDSQKPISASLSNDITLLSSLLATQKALTSSIRLEPKRKVNWQSAISVLLNINEPHIIHGVAGSIGLTSMKCVVYSGYASPSLVDERSDPKGMDQSFTQCAVKLDATRGAMLLENWSRDPRFVKHPFALHRPRIHSILEMTLLSLTSKKSSTFWTTSVLILTLWT